MSSFITPSTLEPTVSSTPLFEWLLATHFRDVKAWPDKEGRLIAAFSAQDMPFQKAATPEQRAACAQSLLKTLLENIFKVTPWLRSLEGMPSWEDVQPSLLKNTRAARPHTLKPPTTPADWISALILLGANPWEASLAQKGQEAWFVEGRSTLCFQAALRLDAPLLCAQLLDHPQAPSSTLAAWIFSEKVPDTSRIKAEPEKEYFLSRDQEVFEEKTLPRNNMLEGVLCEYRSQGTQERRVVRTAVPKMFEHVLIKRARELMEKRHGAHTLEVLHAFGLPSWSTLPQRAATSLYKYTSTTDWLDVWNANALPLAPEALGTLWSLALLDLNKGSPKNHPPTASTEIVTWFSTKLATYPSSEKTKALIEMVYTLAGTCQSKNGQGIVNINVKKQCFKSIQGAGVFETLSSQHRLEFWEEILASSLPFHAAPLPMHLGRVAPPQTDALSETARLRWALHLWSADPSFKKETLEPPEEVKTLIATLSKNTLRDVLCAAPPLVMQNGTVRSGISPVGSQEPLCSWERELALKLLLTPSFLVHCEKVLSPEEILYKATQAHLTTASPGYEEKRSAVFKENKGDYLAFTRFLETFAVSERMWGTRSATAFNTLFTHYATVAPETVVKVGLTLLSPKRISPFQESADTDWHQFDAFADHVLPTASRVFLAECLLALPQTPHILATTSFKDKDAWWKSAHLRLTAPQRQVLEALRLHCLLSQSPSLSPRRPRL